MPRVDNSRVSFFSPVNKTRQMKPHERDTKQQSDREKSVLHFVWNKIPISHFV